MTTPELLLRCPRSGHEMPEATGVGFLDSLSRVRCPFKPIPRPPSCRTSALPFTDCRLQSQSSKRGGVTLLMCSQTRSTRPTEGFRRMTSRRPARWAGGLTTGAAVSTPRFSGPRLSQLKAVFGPGAKKLAAAEAKIVSELVAVQGGTQPALDALTGLNLQRLQRRCIPAAHSKRSSRCLHCSDARPPGIVTLHSDWSPGWFLVVASVG
jgi:hypothetical protein